MKNINETIANTLKELRRQAGWSLETTSKVTGVSKAMLGQIERKESSPTIATLWKIASGFNVSFSSFIDDPLPSEGAVLHRQGEATAISPQEIDIHVMTLFPYDEDLKLEVFMLELLPGCQHQSPPHQPGVIEHVIVTKGELEVFINNTWQPAQTNQGLKFNADQPHGYRNLTNNKVIFYDLIHYPRD